MLCKQPARGPDYPDYPTNIHRPLSLSSSAETVVVRPAKIIENPVEASHSWNIQGYTRIQALVPRVISLGMVASAISGMPPSFLCAYVMNHNLQALECPHVGPEPFVP